MEPASGIAGVGSTVDEVEGLTPAPSGPTEFVSPVGGVEVRGIRTALATPESGARS